MLGSVAAKVYYGLLTLDGGQGGATYVRTIARLGLGPFGPSASGAK